MNSLSRKMGDKGLPKVKVEVEGEILALSNTSGAAAKK